MTLVRRWTLVTLVLAALAAAYGIAQAKYFPLVEGVEQDWGGVDQPVVLSKARGSIMLEGNLSSADDIDAFAYDFQTPVRGFPLQVTIPVCPDNTNADFYPTVALIGPGLPAPEADDALPFDLPDGEGVLIYAIDYVKPDQRMIVKTYGPATYALNIGKWINVPEAGRYTLAVWEPDGHVGPYSISTGDQEPDFENFTAKEIDKMFEQENDGAWVKDACALVTAEKAEATAEATATP